MMQLKVLDWFGAAVALKIVEWLWRYMPVGAANILADFWATFRFPILGIALYALYRVAMDYRATKQRVAEIHQWLYSSGNTAFSIAFARRQIGQPQGTPSLRDLIGIMAEWEHNGRRFLDEANT